MFNKLTIELKNDKKLDFGISSLMQGVLMELIDSGYAETLHEQGLNPYTQHVKFQDGSIKWVISTLTEESGKKILMPLLSDKLEQIHIRHKDFEFKINSRKIESVSYEELLESTYFGDSSPYINMEFVTPTAFKVDGRYRNYPAVSNIFKSLINKHDSISEKTEFYSEELIEQIENGVEIVKYRLRSTLFHLEGVRIPAFLGSITLRIRGPKQFVNLINMLAKFGEFSGVGIKCAIGMGAIEIKENRGKGDRQ